MKIVIDISHPAHVHFFKNFIWEMRGKGHKILITAKDKDMTHKLLDNYGFDYIKLGRHKKSLIRKMMDIPIMDLKMYNAVKKFEPDIILGLASIRAAHASFLLRKKCIIFDDTEHSTKEIMLYLPFVDAVCTPSCFNKDLGKKQIRYNGYHELAYLHPNYFTPDPSVLDELGFKEGERFIVMRFVAWDASHDTGHKGISMEMRRRFVSELEKYGRVLITSEREMPAEFEPYRAKVAPERMHDLLYYAVLYVGEGGTMATEAAVLGAPSVYISSLVGTMGNFEELETKYNLMQSFREPADALEAIHKILSDENSKSMWQKRREILLSEKSDVTAFMVWFIENYPDSLGEWEYGHLRAV